MANKTARTVNFVFTHAIKSYFNLTLIGGISSDPPLSQKFSSKRNIRTQYWKIMLQP